MFYKAKLELFQLLQMFMAAVCIQASVSLGNASDSKTSASELSKRFSIEGLLENTSSLEDFQTGNRGANNLSSSFNQTVKQLPVPVDHATQDDKIVFRKMSAQTREEPMQCWTCPRNTEEDSCVDAFPHNALNGPSACAVLVRGWGSDLCLRYPGGFRITCHPKLRTPCAEDCRVVAGRLSSSGTRDSSPSLSLVLLPTLSLAWPL